MSRSDSRFLRVQKLILHPSTVIYYFRRKVTKPTIASGVPSTYRLQSVPHNPVMKTSTPQSGDGNRVPRPAA